MSTTPPGWHPDPQRPGQLRYWNGAAWTEHRAPGTAQLQTAPNSNNAALQILIGVVVGIMLLCGGGCFAVLAIGDGESPTPTVASTQPSAGHSGSADTLPEDREMQSTADLVRGDQDHPFKITPGKGFDIRGFSYAPGWRIYNEYGMATISGLKVTNNRDRKDTAFVEIKAWRGTEVLADITCSTDDIAVGTTVTLTCAGLEPIPAAYDKLTINDSF